MGAHFTTGGSGLVLGLKRVFVFPLWIALAGVTVFAGHEWVVSGAWPWLGPLLVAIGFPLPYLAQHRAVVGLVGLAMIAGSSAAGWAAYDQLGTQPLLLAVAAAVLQLVHLVWFSLYFVPNRRSPASPSPGKM